MVRQGGDGVHKANWSVSAPTEKKNPGELANLHSPRSTTVELFKVRDKGKLLKIIKSHCEGSQVVLGPGPTCSAPCTDEKEELQFFYINPCWYLAFTIMSLVLLRLLYLSLCIALNFNCLYVIYSFQYLASNPHMRLWLKRFFLEQNRWYGPFWKGYNHLRHKAVTLPFHFRPYHPFQSEKNDGVIAASNPCPSLDSKFFDFYLYHHFIWTVPLGFFWLDRTTGTNTKKSVSPNAVKVE